MIKVGDYVYVTDKDCVAHGENGYNCCDTDLTESVKVVTTNSSKSYPIEVEVFKGSTPLKCRFSLKNIREELPLNIDCLEYIGDQKCNSDCPVPSEEYPDKGLNCCFYCEHKAKCKYLCDQSLQAKEVK